MLSLRVAYVYKYTKSLYGLNRNQKANSSDLQHLETNEDKSVADTITIVSSVQIPYWDAASVCTFHIQSKFT